MLTSSNRSCGRKRRGRMDCLVKPGNDDGVVYLIAKTL
jgi:hypothetical protein